MTKRKQTKATLRFEWSKDNSKQKLYIDFWPPIEKDGKQTRREFLNRTITPLRTAGGEPILKAKGVFKIKENDFVATGVFPRIPKKIKGNAIYYSYSANDEDAIRYCKEKLNNWQSELSAYDNATEAQKKLFFINEQTGQTFENFFVREMQTKNEHTQISYKCTLNWFKRFERDELGIKNDAELSLNDITQDVCNKFRKYIENSDMKQNSKSLYFGKFKVVIGELNKKRLVEPIEINGLKTEETERAFLTLDEIKQLYATPYKCDCVRRMCLFSALTGLRVSDLTNLCWEDIEETEDGYLMHIHTKKTGKLLKNEISQEAYELCGERGKDNEKIFPMYTTSEFYTAIATNINYHIEQWAKQAGIKKKISIHTFRHSYAVQQLEHGTSIETIRELMGHSNLNTTLIYAKVLDDKKKKAANAFSIKND